ncbi:MAG: hypothetical protein MUO73_04160, partial [Thermoplasmata archaeon]|nr:hypothetical protein [Thermoplasmata archaeon]
VRKERKRGTQQRAEPGDIGGNPDATQPRNTSVTGRQERRSGRQNPRRTSPFLTTIPLCHQNYLNASC